MPSLSMEWSNGVNQRAIVIFISLPSLSSNGCCTDHFPYVFLPITFQRSRSCIAHANISEADAEFSFTRTTSGISIIIGFLLFVFTSSSNNPHDRNFPPLFFLQRSRSTMVSGLKKWESISCAAERSHPPLSRRSMTMAFVSFELFLVRIFWKSRAVSCQNIFTCI
jgi:hypothetical protein